MTNWYRDADNDGYGTSQNILVQSTQPAGYIANNQDCDDTKSTIKPGAQEICNSIDDDCDGQADEGLDCDVDGNTISGFIDILNTTLIAGWAYNPDVTTAPVTITIKIDGVIVGTTTTNKARPDVNDAFGIIGLHGFEYTFINFPQGTHNVDIVFGNGATALNWPTTQITKAGSPVEPVQESSRLVGNIDVLDATTIAGWVYDTNDQNALVNIRVVADGNTVATIPANQLRQDVNTALGIIGNHGFYAPISIGTVSRADIFATRGTETRTMAHFAAPTACDTTTTCTIYDQRTTPFVAATYNALNVINRNIPYFNYDGGATMAIITPPSNDGTISSPMGHYVRPDGTAGIVINTALATGTRPLVVLTPAIDFSPGNSVWEGDTSAIEYTMNVRVPTLRSTSSDRTTGVYGVAYYLFKDKTTGKQFWYGARWFDSRGLIEYDQIRVDDWGDGTGTGLPIVVGPLGASQYSSSIGSSRFFYTPSETWNTIGFSVSRAQFQRAINILNSRGYSPNPDDYVLTHANLNTEGFRVGTRYTGAGTLHLEFKDWRIVAKRP